MLPYVSANHRPSLVDRAWAESRHLPDLESRPGICLLIRCDAPSNGFGATNGGEEYRVVNVRKASSVGALLASSTVIEAALVGCSGGDARPALPITKEDGTALGTGGTLRAWCGVPRSEGDAGVSLHVLEGRRAFEQPNNTPTYWIFRAEVEKPEETKRFAIPQMPVDTPSWVLFINDADETMRLPPTPRRASDRFRCNAGGARRGTSSRSPSTREWRAKSAAKPSEPVALSRQRSGMSRRATLADLSEGGLLLVAQPGVG